MLRQRPWTAKPWPKLKKKKEGVQFIETGWFRNLMRSSSSRSVHLAAGKFAHTSESRSVPRPRFSRVWDSSVSPHTATLVRLLPWLATPLPFIFAKWARFFFLDLSFESAPAPTHTLRLAKDNRSSYLALVAFFLAGIASLPSQSGVTKYKEMSFGIIWAHRPISSEATRYMWTVSFFSLKDMITNVQVQRLPPKNLENARWASLSSG